MKPTKAFKTKEGFFFGFYASLVSRQKQAVNNTREIKEFKPEPGQKTEQIENQGKHTPKKIQSDLKRFL